jgi:virginiamycin B lyase
MIKYSYTSNRKVAPFYSLMFLSLIIILGLLSGCGTSTSGPISKQGLKSKINEFPLPAPNGEVTGITKGPDGNLWFTENIPTTQSDKSIGKIGRITPAGKISEFPLPTSNAILEHITTGPDGNLWFTEFLNGTDTGKIGRITLVGKISELLLPPDSLPNGITTGPDGNLWFTTSHRIGRITPAGKISEFTEPQNNKIGSFA